MMKDIIAALCTVARMTGEIINDNQIMFIDKGCPHQSSKLPQGKIGIYMFEFNGHFLKIGKAGAKSNARFQSQPYSPKSSQSNLAKSILDDVDMKGFNLNEHIVGNWIRENVRRYDILIDEAVDIFILNLFEAFLHCKYKPKYEGFEKQRK